MNKNFNTWNQRKISLNNKEETPFFHEREIWWCSVGVNIGSEIDGKNFHFERPVLVVRHFNRGLFWGIPFSSKNTYEKHNISLMFLNKNSFALISQLKLFSGKRLVRKLATINSEQFLSVKSAIRELLE